MLARTILADMVPVQRWWSRTRGLPQEVYEAWVASVRQHPGRQSRVLAWAETPTGFGLGSPAALSYTVGEAPDHDWVHVGWHQIERGGWNSETRMLSWRLLEGRRGALELTTPHRLPELFRERIAASIVLERFVPLTSEESGQQVRGVTVSARRDLGIDPGPVSWHASLTRGTTWSSAGARDAADAAIAQLKSEYDSG